MKRLESFASRLAGPAAPWIALVSGLLAGSCGAVDFGALGGAAGDVAAAAADCPNLLSAKAVSRVDFREEFAVDAEAARRLESALVAAAELRRLAADIDADLKKACGGIARDLGEKPANDSGKAACRAAIRGIEKLRGRAGGKLCVDVVPPSCSASMDAMAECSGRCDVDVDPGELELRCEGGEIIGRCEAQCSGSCILEGGAACSGTCHGSCSAGFSGRCNGECEGKCDGRPTDGAETCGGTCEGSCDGGAHGSCSGECRGECEIEAAARCSGECRGECSVEMKAPRCTGEMKPPRVSAECRARCRAEVNADLRCTRPALAVKVKGASDSQAAAKLVAALEDHLPGVLEVALGMRHKVVAVARNVRSVIKGARAGIQSMAEASGEAAARLTACVAKPFAAAIEAAAGIKVSVEVSVEVHASVEGSGKASTGG